MTARSSRSGTTTVEIAGDWMKVVHSGQRGLTGQVCEGRENTFGRKWLRLCCPVADGSHYSEFFREEDLKRVKAKKATERLKNRNDAVLSGDDG